MEKRNHRKKDILRSNSNFKEFQISWSTKITHNCFLKGPKKACNSKTIDKTYLKIIPPHE